MAENDQVRGVCPHDCPDRCGWVVTVRDRAATMLAGAKEHPDTRGALCAKVDHFLDRVYAPDRVLHPLRRVGPKGSGSFERVSWDRAVGDIATRLRAIIDRHGPTAILPYSFAGTQGLLQANGMGRRFFSRLGASRLGRTICGTTASAGVEATIGVTPGMLASDLAFSRFIVLWGTNTIVTNLHLWPVVREARKKGAKVVVIDPLLTRTAEAADWHVRPMPGSDAALALGMMHVIVADGLHDADYLAKHTVGFDALRARLDEYTPERVAEWTGLDVATITELARAYAATRPAAIRVLVGMEHHPAGEMTFRAVSCLPAIVGAWRERGGGLVHHPMSLFGRALKNPQMPELESPATRSLNMVHLGRALNDPTLTPPIAALFVYASNPAVTTPNQALVLRGLAREDLFTVVHDQFMTDTARFADYVLPATTQLEHWDLLGSWGHTFLSLNRPAIAPLGEARPTTEVFRRLAEALAIDEPYLRQSDEEMIRDALASGHPYLEGITFERLRAEAWAPLSLPEPWMPFANGRYDTPSGKCELYSARLEADGIDPLPAYVPPPPSSPRFPLVLLTPKTAVHFLNSSYSHLPHHRRAQGELWLDLHVADAEPRGIADGALVRLVSEHGALEVRARVGDRVRPGVVAVPSGGWASLGRGGASVNVLTGDSLTMWSGGPVLHGTRVEAQPL
jgi:anaerobic selenocysteine-containing dehydrogenase